MKVSTSQGSTTQHQHFVDSDYRALLEIQRQARFRGLSVSEIVPLTENCRTLWNLTVETAKI